MKILCTIFQKTIFYLSFSMQVKRGESLTTATNNTWNPPQSSTVRIGFFLYHQCHLLVIGNEVDWKELSQKQNLLKLFQFHHNVSKENIYCAFIFSVWPKPVPFEKLCNRGYQLCACAKILNTQDHSVGAVRVFSRGNSCLGHSLYSKIPSCLFSSQQFIS